MAATTIYRTTLLAAALGIAASAHAYIFDVLGTCDSSGTITSTTFTFSSLSEFGTAFSYNVAFFFNGDYTANFTNGASSLALSGTGGAVTFSNNTYSFSGDFNVDSATATSVPIGSTGTYSATFDLNAGFFSYSIAGAPTPEPASIAALGLGVLVIARRRRKA